MIEMMRKPGRPKNRSFVAALAIVGFGLAGCTQYTVRTTLSADGSGRRSEEMQVTQEEGKKASVSPQEYVYLMGASPSNGWTHTTEVDGEDTTHIFRRERRIADLAAWSGLNGTVEIKGTTEDRADTKVGYVVLGDVRFLNRVRVARAGTPDARTFSYSETFFWENGPDPVVEHMALSFADAVGRAYPQLDAKARGELIGLVRGGLWAAIDQGLLTAKGGDEDTLVTAFVGRTAEEAARTVSPSDPEAARTAFEAALRSQIESDDSLDAFIDRTVPGLNLAFDTSIEFRLVMPGRVTASNADHQEGDTLVWKFSPADALGTPIKVRAESVLERR